ncbi:hypothetical protein Cni_G06058 [Canna indica]|uniref:Bulb-type lectin domain-containing protein n=1 Tax=Canna indica TaxID=4628 RepID=A0AAQ3Q3Q2_9LILI|nr:hypothetical protein Cni_G06058 [Canna indica]
MARAPTLLLLLLFFFFLHALAVLGEVALFSHIKSTLSRGESLSNNGSTLTLQSDCDLVLRNANNMIVWNSGSVDNGVDCIFWVGKYGVAIVSDVDGSPLWTTGSPSPRGNYAIILRPDGTLRMYGPSIWTFLGSSSSNGSSTDTDASVSDQLTVASAPSIDSSGHIMYSSEEFIDRPSVGVLLKRGNFSLVVETACKIHIRHNHDLEAAASCTEGEVKGSAAPTCKSQLTTDGQLAAYKRIFPDDGGLDDVWLRTWGSDYTIVTKESVAALIDRGATGELLIYPTKQTLAA